MKQLLFMAALFFQLTAQAQYQVQKGNWFISHTVGGYAFSKMEWTQSEEGRPDQVYTSKNNEFQLGFSGPDWGSVLAGSYKSEDETTGTESDQTRMALWLQPQAGYFIRNNLMIGASALMGFESGKSTAEESSDRGRNWSLGIGPMMRYYFGENSKRKLFAGFESRFDITRGNSKNYYSGNFTGDRNEYRTNGSKEMVRPFLGCAFFLGKRWAADVRADYTYTKETATSTRWYYEDETLDPNYPETQKLVITTNAIAISFGISYTF